jgi:hypothetical protein
MVAQQQMKVGMMANQQTNGAMMAINRWREQWWWQSTDEGSNDGNQQMKVGMMANQQTKGAMMAINRWM